MEITEYKKLIQIRLYLKPIYFKNGFIGGRMERKVLVVNPGDSQARCINITKPVKLKKLPTIEWCRKIWGMRGMTAITDSKEYLVVWEGKIGITKYNLLAEMFNGDHKL